ncbi:hypothetical protein WA026_010220 [Henosepilachna vigintioctopunctata]|uniref:Uncharacterized protein n=1 Tax=Henosepilachna vigintioctopunctata TaxID=420089 RepID=A0AAW1UGX0_9CUCU
MERLKNGLGNKTNELEHLTQTTDIDIILIQETKLNKTNPPKIRSYTPINKPNGKAHGLVTYYKKTLSDHLLHLKDIIDGIKAGIYALRKHGLPTEDLLGCLVVEIGETGPSGPVEQFRNTAMIRRPINLKVYQQSVN